MVNLFGVGLRCLLDFLCLIAAANSHLFVCTISVLQTLLVWNLFFVRDMYQQRIAWSIRCIWPLVVFAGTQLRSHRPWSEASAAPEQARPDCVAKHGGAGFSVLLRQAAPKQSQQASNFETCSIADHSGWLRILDFRAPILSSVQCHNESPASNWSFPTLNRSKPTTTVEIYGNILSICMQWTSLHGYPPRKAWSEKYLSIHIRCINMELLDSGVLGTKFQGRAPVLPDVLNARFDVHLKCLAAHFDRQVQKQGQSDAALQAKQYSIFT